ncbi:tRNA-dihydrouridine synthase family protein [Candidatus Parcubacteria bacterium]|nr:tRNA-dihydrouridine synthase family protein [Candidatus Parcubacteria bacterium]
MKNFWKKIKKPILALAPMAGYTTSSFRQICKYHGADVVYSELASATALSFQGKRTLELLEFERSEQPFVVQLFGNDPKYFSSAAEFVSEKIRPDGIDINMGCPAKKVFSSGSGAALMNKPEVAREIIKETLRGTNLPVSIKIRAKVGKMTAYKFIKKLNDLPIAAIMVHGRSLKQGFAGEINYEQIKKVMNLVDIPVLANGGINSPEDARRMLQRTGADGIGIARGALTKPWLFSQTKEFLKTGEYQEFELEEIKKASLVHAEMAYKSMGKHGIIQMRKYLLWYFRGFENAKEIRKELVQVESMGDIKRVLKGI